MKTFLRIYFFFCVVIVSFSCSDEESDNQNNEQQTTLSIVRFNNAIVPNSIAAKSTYVDPVTGNQLTTFFRYDGLGNIERLTHVVSDDGSGLSTIIAFDDSGAINAIYRQNPDSGEIVDQVFIAFEDGVTTYSNGLETGQLTQSATMETMGEFLGTEDDLLFSQAINQNLEVLKHIAFFSDTNNRATSAAPLVVFGVVMIAVGVLYVTILVENENQQLEKERKKKNSGGMVQCDIFGDCGQDRRASNSDDCNVTYTDFVCSEVVDELPQITCDNSNLEVTIGVDPGNVLVAIVNGDSENYEFVWSTGETDQGIISSNITVQEAGEYYVLVQDENGCVAIGFVTVDEIFEDCEGLTTFTDPRDGQIYPVVQIGNQCWMAKNMNYNTGTNWCYDNNPSNCNIYGRLYNRPTALTVCPEGWHLPNAEEWEELANFLGGALAAGGKMKSTTGWLSPNTGASNSSGFSGLAGGSRTPSGNFSNVNRGGYFHSSTQNTSGLLFRNLWYESSTLVFGYVEDNSRGFSCRCVKD